MAYTTNPIVICRVRLRYRNGKETTTVFGIKLGQSNTEAQAQVKLAAIATAIQAATGAIVKNYSMTMVAEDNTILIDDPTGQPFRSIEDKAKLRVLPVGGAEKEVVISLPGPVTALFDSSRQELVNVANEALQAFVTWAKGYAVTYGKQRLGELLGGNRDRSRIRRELPGTLPILPA